MHDLKRGHNASNPATDSTSSSATKTTAVDQDTTELMARFFVSQGIALECAQESPFQELIKHISPNCMVPKTDEQTRAMDKICSASKPLVNYQKTDGPLSATIDITGEKDQKYIALSIHYFEDLYERKSAVYLRKLILGT
ncbi:SKN-1 Dependent Zygotic transcript [Caenorhabditis elegans]|uniref:SKN-1 Dependent Zygotic transcript n=1 Tax=Caenorhabditis elegans TaxID=6239 RepID=O62242_CAEEL|nr:SKN-1 Dependent Zygotic transcript [Caenorhabditis elegans]CAA92182.2 SKN-1 Dependent Zygotic transcript [Caenorhabditis elegans]|eukprot:NP_510097.2 SKN-1 Dependent Zygotic transcript [Caenorhabditis elegans]